MAPNNSAHTVINVGDDQYVGVARPRAGYHHIDPVNEHDIEMGAYDDIVGRKVTADDLYYISPTDYKPAPMIIQAAPQAFKERVRWNRVGVAGNAPVLLKLSSWVLGNGASDEGYSKNIVLVLGKMLIAFPPQLLFLMWPWHHTPPMTSFYRKFPSKTKDYPLYTRNQFDASPNAPSSVSWAGATYTISGDQKRLIHPRNLIVKSGNKWDITSDESQTAQPYVVISYTTVHFKVDASRRGVIEELAEKMAEEAGVKAYWLDYRCRASKQPELTDDVHRICDVFRGARHVIVVLPDLTEKSKKEWGQRIWTLTEVLLSAAHQVKFVSPEQTIEYTKIDISREIWTDGEPTRLLAEHYSGLLTLSRLELISLGLNALSSRKSEKEWTPGDIAYALMALLRYRIRMNPKDTLFQALARLSLANDSDRIVERMICLLPDPEKIYDTSFVLDDTYGANLWDIEPLCQIAGVGENDEVIINGCRAISIRWKDFPRVQFIGNGLRQKIVVQYILNSVPVFVFVGIYFMVIYGITQSAIDKATSEFSGDSSSGASVGGLTLFYKYIGIVFLIIGVLIAVAAPWLVIPVYGGKVREASPWLIGFEGVLPIRKIEHLTFGNVIGRLSYAPSSSLIQKYHSDDGKTSTNRLGAKPSFVENSRSTAPLPSLPKGHRLFTLVDTSTMTVSIFSAAKPPSVALICGNDGGMLRVVLCSYKVGTNCLHKETVLRMEAPMMDQARSHTWLKVDLSFLEQK